MMSRALPASEGVRSLEAHYMKDGRKAKLSEQTADKLYELIFDERQFAPGSTLPQ